MSRQAVRVCVLIAVATLMATLAAAQVPSEYDNCPQVVQDLMSSIRDQYGLAGAQFAVAPNGILTCAGAIGYADPDTQRVMHPNTLMRIASVSKSLTGMAIAKLYEDGKLDLDDRAVDYVPDLVPPFGFNDPRWQDVTIRNLAQHSMGWDRAIGGAPIRAVVAIADVLGERPPASSEDVIRWLLTATLHFDPGTKASYTVRSPSA